MAAWCHAASAAHAQDDKRTLVIAPRARPQAAEVDLVREVRAALSDVDGIALLPPAPLDLEAVQLAIDCPDTNARCLRAVAERMEARVLVVPTFSQSGGEASVRILYFDRGAGEEPRTVVRRGEGKAARQELTEGVPEMIRELLGVEDEPAELPEPSEDATAEAAPPEATVDRESDSASGLPVGPLVLGGVGLGAIAAGLTVGALMKSTQDEYASRVIDSEAQARSAEADRKRGERQAVVANVLLGTGVAAAVAAGVWLALDTVEKDDAPAQTALVPMLGPRAAGVSWLGTWEDP